MAGGARAPRREVRVVLRHAAFTDIKQSGTMIGMTYAECDPLYALARHEDHYSVAGGSARAGMVI